MWKKMVSVILAALLSVTLCIPAFAAEFSDLSGHWAREYMEDLADKGYFTGYEDDTMRPEKSVTICEALVVMSRFYDLDDEAAGWINSDYSETVKEAVASSLSWAYDELSVCLAAGIITRDELSSMDLTSAIKKEQLSVFLVRGMQLQNVAEAQSGTVLSFDDASEIGTGNIGYIAVLVSAGIVKGDENNDFCPNLSVTRAVFATMVSRSLDYMQAQSIDLEIESYEGVTRTDGIITGVGSGSLIIKGFDGLTKEFVIASSTAVTVNDTVKSLTASYIGCSALVTEKEGSAILVAIESDANTKWVQGMIYNVAASSATDYLYIKDQISGSSTKYSVPSAADVTYNGTDIDFSSLASYNYATLKFVSDVVTEVWSYPGDFELNGTITDIEYATTTVLKIEDDDGIIYHILLNMSDLPDIKRGDTEISLDRLGAGNKVTVEYDNCELTSITTEGTQNSVKGVLTSITATASKTTWTISTDSGTSNTYTVDEAARAYNGTKAILLSDIKVGDTVSVEVYGDTITEINLEGSAMANSKVSGTVLSVNTKSKEITVLSSGKLIYIDASSIVSIISAATGSSQSFSSIKADEQIVAYGAYKSSTQFKATSIVIEG
jgi:hypothetical protein